MAHLPTAPNVIELASSEEAVDPELVSLPDPPRTERNLTVGVLLLTTVAALLMCAGLARDVGYAAGSSSVVELGDLGAVAPTALTTNAHMRASALLGAAGGLRYERPFEADSYRLVPVAGRTDVWVEIRVPERQETGRFVPPSSFDGRLVRMDSAGLRHRGLFDLASSATKGVALGGPERVWLLVDGETPDRMRWAVILSGLFLGFAVWNVLAMARLLKRVR